MNQNVKSSTVAGLLGIFLGAFGGHNWYLGEKSKGIIHVCLAGVGIILEIVAAVMAPKDAYSIAVAALSGGFGWTTILSVVGGLIISASAVWGVIEGIMILSQGDAGLARKGYAVAAPAQMQNQGYGYPNQPYYGQPMQGQPMGQPMQGQPMMQPMQGQPMQGQPMMQPMQNQPAPEQPVQNQPVEPVNTNPVEATQTSSTNAEGNN